VREQAPPGLLLLYLDYGLVAWTATPAPGLSSLDPVGPGTGRARTGWYALGQAF